MCSCLPSFIGSPPACRPECVVSTECSLDKSCINQKCTNPCPASCGLSTNCRVVNHSPICTCKNGYTGDPLTRCFLLPSKTFSPLCYNCLQSEIVVPRLNFNFYYLPEPIQDPIMHQNPCVPSPCGSYSECRDVNNLPACSCAPSYIGSPPNCRPECTINSDCPSNQACLNEKCQDPCPGLCGLSARCSVLNHVPSCTCVEGFSGDPFVNCYPKPPRRKDLFYYFPEFYKYWAA